MKETFVIKFKQALSRQISAARRANIFGFSLVEVTLALGITAFGLVALMGMLPKSLSTLQEAGQITAQTRIAQQLIGDVMLNDWKKLDTVYPNAKSAAGEIKFFDDQSIEIKTGSDNFERDLVYVARMKLPDAATAGVKLPGANNFSSDLRRIVVDVIQSNRQLSGGDFDDEKAQSKIRTFSSIITNMGKEAN